MVWSFISILILPFVSQAADKRLLLDELYTNAHLERQLSWIQASMTLNQGEFALPQQVVDTVNRVVKVRYSRDFFRESMTATLDEALSVGELLKLIDWYGSPLGQKILRLEAEANNPANAERMQAYIAEKLSQKNPRNSRIMLMEDLMEALDAVELGTELAASASVSAKRLLREVMPGRATRDVRPVQILKAQEKPAIRRDISNNMLNLFLYTYRSLPDYEIQQYLEFARNTAMRNFQRGQTIAMARMM